MTACRIEEIARLEGFLDRAADEVFSTMMGVLCVPVEPTSPRERQTISAVIGLAGAMSGSVVLHCGSQAAMKMAGHLTGFEPGEVDATVWDAVGEMCNMLAGTWKGLDADLASGCLLSTPTIIAGSSYELFSQRAPIRIERSYRFEDQTFTMTLYCEHLSFS